MKRQGKAYRSVTLVLSLLILTLLAGCGSLFKQKLHPLTNTDIFFDDIDGNHVTCFSDYYLEEVMKVKLET